MQELLEILMASVKAVLGNMLGTVIVGVAVFLLVLLVLLPPYVLSKRRGSAGPFVTFQMGSGQVAPGPSGPGPAFPGQAQTSPAQPVGQPWDDRREELLLKLDTVERGLGRFYIVLLCLGMACATGLMVFLYVKSPDEGNRQVVVLYGGVAYALGMLWMTAQIFSMLRRISPPPDMLSGMRSRINVTFQSSPQVQFIDDQALTRAQQHLSGGGSLDDACALVEPRYRSMNGVMQQVFRKAIEAALEQRRTGR
jgi:hypothetical protein